MYNVTHCTKRCVCAKMAGNGRTGKMKKAGMMILAAAIYAEGACMGCRAENKAAFLRGYDASFCSEFGKDVHRGSDGKPCDIFYLLKEHGINCVRLRVWNNPSSPDNPDTPGNSDLDTVAEQAVRAKKAGLKVMLDFHYSDYWADPGKQYIPGAWTSCTTADEMGQKLYDYTASVLRALARENASPDYVQVGNEINPGLLVSVCRKGDVVKADEAVSGRWHGKNYIAYLKKGCAAVRAEAPEAKIIIHFADCTYVESLMEDVSKAGIDFDIYGLSYYPFEASHGTLGELGEKIRYGREKLGKDVIVTETGWYWHTWTQQNYGAVGYAKLRNKNGKLWRGILTQGQKVVESVQNQENVIHAVIDVTQANGGLGVFFWEDGKPGSWRGLFDSDGKAMPGLDALGGQKD
jgi:arabinogalactan endo-1,4-beta-galactosidase